MVRLISLQDLSCGMESFTASWYRNYKSVDDTLKSNFCVRFPGVDMHWAAVMAPAAWNTGRMMTSFNGNIFRVTGPLCGEFTGHRRIPLTKTSDAELWCFLWTAPLINSWVNISDTGILRRHRAHYDVIVMDVKSPKHSFLFLRDHPWAACHVITWWRHQMETYSALLALCAGNSPVAG